MTKTSLRLIGYVRVSTAEQARSGLGAAAQRAKIAEAVARDGHELVEVIADDGEHGTSLQRPGLHRALSAIAADDADGLVAVKLDRVSRSVVDFGTLLGWFTEAKAALVILDPGIDTTTAAGRLVANVFASVAEWEADTITERTRDALAAKRARGERIGRAAVVDDANLAKRIRALRSKGMTLRAIADKLTADCVPTVRGGARWQVSAVQSVLGYRRPPARRNTELPDPRPRKRSRKAA
jgi:DNA invertase Pin-like site-specific DNA recombinase